MKLLSALLVTLCAAGQDLPTHLPEIRFHLTARPWKPLAIPRDAYLDSVEGICRFMVQHLDSHGAVIDPYLHREHQYSTPYFAFAVAALAHAGRAHDLLSHGIRAMEHATSCFAGGRPAIPDDHGEFFVPALTGALELFRGRVPDPVWREWERRLRTPLDQVLAGGRNNWRTYPMKGEWMRARLGLVSPASATKFIRSSWQDSQRIAVYGDKWNLYQDRSSDPDSLAVEAVGRGNLLALIAEGYNGPHADEIRQAVERASLVSLLLQDPSGQCPMNGRTDDHVFNDVLYQLAFEVMAERARAAGRGELAGSYRHAAMLSFQSASRWRRTDPPWAGSFYVTKNRFDPADRVNYQPASNYGNYNGAIMMHLAEAWLAHRSEIAERPAPAETGGYVLSTDANFGAVFANAGGMQIAANLRGDHRGRYGVYWTPLGIVRIARSGWDTRLGPSDGVRDSTSLRGVSFGPEWKRDGSWVRLADLPADYRGTADPVFAHPLLVRFRLSYRAVIQSEGPVFLLDFTITPDGALVTLRGEGAKEYGVTLPLLENDGTPLAASIHDGVASSRYPGGSDEQNFIALAAGASLEQNEPPLRSPYGWLRPVRLTAPNPPINVFIYPRGVGDPTAEEVKSSFRRQEDGFSSVLGRVSGTLYVGRTSAGGYGDRIDIDGDSRPDVTFSRPCDFILQVKDGRVTAIEASERVTARLSGRTIPLAPYTPRLLKAER